MNLNNPENTITVNYSAVFESFWNSMNANYLYWDIDRDKINWDELYTQYKPKFAALNINDPKDLVTGKGYLQKMTEQLSDGHFNITFNSPMLQSDTIWPAKKNAQQRTGIKISDNTLYKLNQQKYFTSYSYSIDESSDLKILLGLSNNNKILYFHYNTCYLREKYQSNPNIRKIIDLFYRHLIDPTIASVIIDLRNNTGGDVSDLNFFLGSFIESQHQFGYIKYKNSINRLDYTPYLNATIIPVNRLSYNRKPFYILINGNTISMAEISALAFKSFPKTILIGERTFGALGMLSGSNSLYNGGSFKVGSFMNISQSTASLSGLDFKNYEGIGIAPNKYVDLTSNNNDDQLEYAIGLAKSNL